MTLVLGPSDCSGLPEAALGSQLAWPTDFISQVLDIWIRQRLSDMRRWEAVSQFSPKRLPYSLSHWVVLQGAASSPSSLINYGVSLMTLSEKSSLHTYLRHL